LELHRNGSSENGQNRQTVWLPKSTTEGFPLAIAGEEELTITGMGDDRQFALMNTGEVNALLEELGEGDSSGFAIKPPEARLGLGRQVKIKAANVLCFSLVFSDVGLGSSQVWTLFSGS
jgi:hypothetical protein